jgi:hypothetical protein
VIKKELCSTQCSLCDKRVHVFVLLGGKGVIKKVFCSTQWYMCVKECIFFYSVVKV